ncbi:MAG: N-formylglutamate amidohydrolase [Pseudomonadota bacterium]
MQAGYRVLMPEVRTTSVVFASPHSGRDYPPEMMRRTSLSERAIRSSEDAFVDLLFDSAPVTGAPLITATVPRAYVDFNRSREELDPALIEGVRRASHNPRVSSGLGVIPRVVANGRPIYRGKLPRDEADRRLEQHWAPYHLGLETLLQESRALFGEAVLVDCHSMPHEALESVAHPGGLRPEIVIGDRFGASASAELVDRIEAAFVDAGLVVVRNAPFAGAYSTQNYGRPGQNQHVVQVEIDRALYMDERTIRPNAGFADLRERLTRIIAEVSDLGRPELPLAAE